MKLEVIETPETKVGLSVSRFDEIQKLKSKKEAKKGYVYVGDKFEASEDLAKYFLGDNRLKKAFVKVVEDDKKDKEPKEDKTEKTNKK